MPQKGLESFPFCLLTDLNRLGSANGFNVPPTENAPVCPPNSGHLMAEKMKLGRLDQGDSDAGKTKCSPTLDEKDKLEFN